MEPGRLIVKQQRDSGGDAVPWINTQRFVDLCARRTVEDFERRISSTRRVFFDRSFVDVAAAVERLGLEWPEGLSQAIRLYRYAPIVFMSKPWENLFGEDSERRHTFKEAVAEYESLGPAYLRLGYKLVFLPQASTLERAAFVHSAIARPESGVA